MQERGRVFCRPILNYWIYDHPCNTGLPLYACIADRRAVRQ